MDFSRLITGKPCQDVHKNDVNFGMLQAAWQLEKKSQTIRHLCEMFNATGVQTDPPTR